MNLMRFTAISLLMFLLSACSLMHTTPVAPPPPTDKAQEITRAQTSTLTKISTISAQVRGSPMDVEAAIAAKANAAGAHYYMIIFNSETVIPGQWYSQAILYK